MARKKSLKGLERRAWPKRLELLTACPLCSAVYKPAQAQVLGEEHGSHLLHIQCERCGNAVLALLITGAHGMSTVGMVTDLTSEDALRYKDALGVNSDDVIAIHEMLLEGKDFVLKLKNL